MPRIPVNLLIPLMKEATDLTVTRSSGVTVNAYGETTATTTEVEIPMVVHQATRKQIERAGLDYGHDWRAFYAAEELRTANPGPPDVVTYQGQDWMLYEVANYGNHGGVWIALGRVVE